MDSKDSTTKSDIELPPRNLSQRWRRYGHNAKRRVFERFSKWCPKGTATSNLFIYLQTDQTFPEFVVKSVIGFFGGIVLTYLCFVFFVFQLSISLIHATIMSSIIGVLLTFGLAFSYRIRCLVFLLIPQLFSRVGRYTLTCYALILILTGPATNTLKNSEVLTESMACTQEQIKTDVKQITDSMKKPFSSMRDAIKLMIKGLNEISYKMDVILAKINRLITSIVDVLQSSYMWLNIIIQKCNQTFGTPYEHCVKLLSNEAARRNVISKQPNIFSNNSFIASTVCSAGNLSKVCNAPDYLEDTIAATIMRKLKTFRNRVKAMFFFKIHMHHSYTFTTNSSYSPSQVTAGIVTEIRNRADPLLTWLSWSSCITSLFLLLILFRAKYYQHMYETRSRFDNRYITKELRDLDLQRSREGKETVLPLNRREREKYVTTTSLRLVATEKVHLTRSVVFMTITTFKLMIHMIADYSLYWVLTTIRYHGKRQTPLPPGPMDLGLLITGTGLIADLIRAVFKAVLYPILAYPSPASCLPNPYPPDLKRYAQIGVLIFFLWFFALFEPYGLRLRHLIMGHYRPQRAKARAAWLYNHILRTRGSFMKFARRKLHKEFKYLPEENLTFRHWIRTRIPFRWLRCMLGITPLESKCLLCYATEVENLPNTELIRCETQNCLGTYCNSCFLDIGRLCTICLSPVDYGDFSDISLEKGSSEDSEDSSRSETDKTYLLPKRKYFTRWCKSRESNEYVDDISNLKKSNSRKTRYYSSNNTDENNDKAPLLKEAEDDIITNALGFKEISVPKNYFTVGFVYYNYFCDNNRASISTSMLKKYCDIEKDCNHVPRKNCKVNYGSIGTSLNPEKVMEVIPKINKVKYQQEKPMDTLEHAKISLKMLPKSRRGKKRSHNQFKTQQSKLLEVKRKYSRNLNKKRKNKMVFDDIKRKFNKSLCGIKSSMTTMRNRLQNGNIQLNIYDIRKSSIALKVSKVSMGRTTKYHRKSVNSKTNDLTKGRKFDNKPDKSFNEPELRNNSLLKEGNMGVNDIKSLKINNNNREIPRTTDRKGNFNNRLRFTKIRKLISHIMIGKFTSKGIICYTQKKSKSLCFLNYNHNYKRRKRSRNQIKEYGRNKTPNIKRDIEMTRKYRIYRFLKEGEWMKTLVREVSEPIQENTEITGNKIEDCYFGLYTKKRIPKSNEHFKSCNFNDNKDHNYIEKPMHHTNVPLSPKNESLGDLGKLKVNHPKLSSSVKSFSLKDTKLYIADKFLHLKFASPLTVLRNFLSTFSLGKDKVSSSDINRQDNAKADKAETADKEISALPITKPCSCACDIMEDQQRGPCVRQGDNTTPVFQHRIDKETQTEINSCTCAVQYKMDDIKKINNDYDRFIHDWFKGHYGYETCKDTKRFTCGGTQTDTTLCSCISTIDFINEAPKLKITKGVGMVKVIAESNKSSETDKTSRNASTVTDDWWSPIVEKKDMDYKRKEQEKKKKRDTEAKIMNRRLVTFKST